MANKFTGITSAGVNVPVYDKEAHQALGNVYTKSEVDTELNTKQDKLSTEQLYNIDHALTTSAGLMEESKLSINSNHITAYNGIPFSAQGGGGGGATYEGVAPIVVDNTENKISADTIDVNYQQFTHDDSLVHVSNDAQYALGVNVPYMKWVMGVDETLLFSGASTSACPLSEPLTAFDKIKIMYSRDGNCQIHEFSSNVSQYHKDVITFGSNTVSAGWGKVNLNFQANSINVISAWAYIGNSANTYASGSNQYAMNSIGAIWGVHRKEWNGGV